MIEAISQRSLHFDELTGFQCGWEAEFIQLGPAARESRVNLVQSGNAAVCNFQFNSRFDQRMYIQPGYYSFGFLESDTTEALVQGKGAPPGDLVAFPCNDEAHGVSSAGFHGNGIHFRDSYLEAIAETAFKMPLRQLVPEARIFALTGPLRNRLRREMNTWLQLDTPTISRAEKLIARREEALAIAVLNAVSHSSQIHDTPFQSSDKVVKLVLDYVHSEPSEEITAMEMCAVAGCSQRWLEYSFRKRFGVTPKKYVKYLRLSRLRHDLLHSFETENRTVIELAIVYGFWHMSQLAADYRKVYGELPSETLKKGSNFEFL